jgi:hypothetical protein
MVQVLDGEAIHDTANVIPKFESTKHLYQTTFEILKSPKQTMF